MKQKHFYDWANLYDHFLQLSFFSSKSPEERYIYLKSLINRNLSSEEFDVEVRFLSEFLDN